jgi:hypothetical protein
MDFIWFVIYLSVDLPDRIRVRAILHLCSMSRVIIRPTTPESKSEC